MASDTSAFSEEALREPGDFSLVLGGPLFQLLRRSQLSGDALELMRGDFPGFRWAEWNGRYRDGIRRFVQQLIAFRQHHPCLRHRRFLTGKPHPGSLLSDVTWHGVELNAPLWGDPNAQILAYTLGAAEESEEDLHIILDMSENAVEMPLPQLSDQTWYRAIDTAHASPEDIVEPWQQDQVRTPRYTSAPRSVIVLESR
jgi:glycogen operon protein